MQKKTHEAKSSGNSKKIKEKKIARAVGSIGLVCIAPYMQFHRSHTLCTNKIQLYNGLQQKQKHTLAQNAGRHVEEKSLNSY